MASVKILASYISDGRVVAMSDVAVYVYKHELSEDGKKKLLGLLGKTPEINLDHWEVEWEKESYGS